MPRISIVQVMVSAIARVRYSRRGVSEAVGSVVVTGPSSQAPAGIGIHRSMGARPADRLVPNALLRGDTPDSGRERERSRSEERAVTARLFRHDRYMSSLPESIGQLARGLSRLFRLPSAAILLLATAAAGLAVLLAVVNLTSADPAGAGHWVVLGLAVLLALPVALVAFRRRRWLAAVEGSAPAVVSTELVAPDELADRV